jgi:hypothetical protein
MKNLDQGFLLAHHFFQSHKYFESYSPNNKIIFIGISNAPQLDNLLTVYLKLVNSFHVMAVNKRPTFGVYLFRGHISLKNRTYCPLLATIQRLSKARVFLLRVEISKGCFVSNAPPAISRPYLIIETNSWRICGYHEKWCKVLPARVFF